jgi:hypothetical protein
MRKIGRNDPCWCGSGRKFKHCHLDREKQEPIPTWEAESELRKAFSINTCSAPLTWRSECSKQISKAHTVPKSGSLERIARAGHVYSFVPNLRSLSKNQGILVPQLIGINRASTFTGFCSRHDDAIFAPLEKTNFAGTAEQCFLLAYRAQTREAFTKEAAMSLKSLRHNADRGSPVIDQAAIQAFNFFHETGLAAGLRDTAHYKSVYDDVLLNARFEDVRAYIIEIDGAPPVMCSGGVFPEQDFEGTNLQDVADLKMTPHLLNFAAFYAGTCGAVVFAWLPESDRTCQELISSLDRVPDRDLTDSLLRFFFEFCENVHIQPAWWEHLPSSTRDSVQKRVTSSANPIKGRQDGCLTDDGVRFPPWVIRQRYRLGPSL